MNGSYSTPQHPLYVSLHNSTSGMAEVTDKWPCCMEVILQRKLCKKRLTPSTLPALQLDQRMVTLLIDGPGSYVKCHSVSFTVV